MTTEFRQTFRRLVFATLFVYVALIGLGLFVYVDAGNQRDALAESVRTTNHALCTFVGDLRARVEQSERFLLENPSGIPGISPAFLRTSIHNQRRAIDSLDALKC